MEEIPLPPALQKTLHEYIPEVQLAVRLPTTLKVWNVIFIPFFSSSENPAQGFWETDTPVMLICSVKA